MSYVKESYELAKKRYAEYGIDTDKVLETLKNIPISMHCWQGDDVIGFENPDGELTGGIQTTGNYPGKATTPEELMADLDKAFSLIPGKKKLNLHACYAIFEKGEFAVIVGASGAGKTTVLNMLGGMDRCDEGSIMVDGIDVARSFQRSQISVVSDHKTVVFILKLALG